MPKKMRGKNKKQLNFEYINYNIKKNIAPFLPRHLILPSVGKLLSLVIK